MKAAWACLATGKKDSRVGLGLLRPEDLPARRAGRARDRRGGNGVRTRDRPGSDRGEPQWRGGRMKRLFKGFGILSPARLGGAGGYYYFFMREKKPQVELYFDDGSMLALPGSAPEAAPFVDPGRRDPGQEPGGRIDLAADLAATGCERSLRATLPRPGGAGPSPRPAPGRGLRRALRRGPALPLPAAGGRRIEDVSSGVDRGASVRLVRGLSTSFGYVDSLDEAALAGVGRPAERQHGRGAVRSPHR